MLRTKRSFVAAVLAGSVATIVPSAPAVAMAPCQGRAVGSVVELHETVVVVGAYTSAGATDVELTCGIVRRGETVVRLSEGVPGPAAAVAGVETVLSGFFTFCYEIRVTYLDRPPTWTDTCP